MADGSTFTPENAPQIAEVVAWAVSQKKPLEVVGAGTKRGIGRAAQYDASLGTNALQGVTLYEPEELVLSARAGTPMREIEALLEENRQELAFEPPDLGGLFGQRDAGTIGGALAANLAGPRRLKAGAARDHFLGFTAVSGRGEIFKSGGRVVKNVTGYDLCKMMAGSWGTLAIMSDVTVKVLPAAETQATVVVIGLSEAAATQAMAAAMQSSCEVSGACHLPPDVARVSGIRPVSTAARSVTALRIEGVAASVIYRSEKLTDLLRGHGDVEVLDEPNSRALWREVRDVDLLPAAPDRALWRLSVPPMAGADVYQSLSRDGGVSALFDWAGGLVWLDMPRGEDGGAARIAAAIAASGGHATLYRGDDALRSSIDVFQQPTPGVAALSRRLKEGFDPSGILNPGRMQASG